MTETQAAESSPDEHQVRSRHTLDLGQRELGYEAEAGTFRIRRDDHSPLADVFYLAYRADAPAGSARPLTFLFNGGPGSASLWLNIGGFGPRRAPTDTPEPTAPAPYRFGDNPHSLLTESDLVFIDAVGTGYSRLVEGADPAEVWGVDQDVDAFARAITRYLTITGSWLAPRYLFGESYGTTRAAALVHRLQNQGLDFNGVVLLSTFLNHAPTLPGADQGYVNLLPTMAATARYHGRAGAGRDSDPQSLETFLSEVRAFAQQEYAPALAAGDRISPTTEAAVADRLAAYLGIEASELRRRRLRVELEEFRRLLLAGSGRVIGRFDTRFVAEHQYVVGSGSFDPSTDDAATAGVTSAHLSSFRAHLDSDLGYRNDLHYRHLHNVVIEGAWDWRHKAPGIDEVLPLPDVSLDLSAALRRNPNLAVFALGGVYDLATPFYAVENDIAHLYLGDRLRGNVSFRWYESGHMTFVDESALASMAADLRHFYQRTSRTL